MKDSTEEKRFVKRMMNRMQKQTRIIKPRNYQLLLKKLYNDKRAWEPPGIRHSQITRKLEFSHQLTVLSETKILHRQSSNFGSLMVDILNNKPFIGKEKISEIFNEYVGNLEKATQDGRFWNFLKEGLRNKYRIQNKEQLIKRLLVKGLDELNLFNYVVRALLKKKINVRKLGLGILEWRNGAHYYYFEDDIKR